MDFSEKKMDLINLIKSYLDNKCTLEALEEFSWEMIHYFSTHKKLPPNQDFEKEFWYAIWQIQHLADQDHERDDVTKKILTEALDYLLKKKKIPYNYVGDRP